MYFFIDDCTVNLLESENSNQVNQTIRGGKIRNGVCVIEKHELIYAFKFMPNETMRKCLCNVDAWLQYENGACVSKYLYVMLVSKLSILL